jgi:hypothetical protein
MSFSLITDHAVLTWDDGKVEGVPLTAVGDAQMAIDTQPYIAGTPTGPWFEQGTPEHAYLVLRALAPDAEVIGDPPHFERLCDERPARQLPPDGLLTLHPPLRSSAAPESGPSRATRNPRSEAKSSGKSGTKQTSRSPTGRKRLRTLASDSQSRSRRLRRARIPAHERKVVVR